MPHIAVVHVCLPKGTLIDQPATTAVAQLGSTPFTSAGPAGHFPVTTRTRCGSLVPARRGTAAGGPIRRRAVQPHLAGYPRDLAAKALDRTPEAVRCPQRRAIGHPRTAAGAR